MAQRFIEPIARIFTNAGAVGVGYKYYFYATGTTTPVTTYQDDGLSVANTNPVVSDANGRFPEIWYSDLSQLKLVVKDSSGNTIDGAGADPVGAPASAVSLNDFDVRPTSYWNITAGTSTAYTLIANPTISSYDNTQTFFIQFHVTCGASPTLAIDGLSAFNLKKYTGQGTKVAIQAGDLQATQRYIAINDGVDIVILNPRSIPLNIGTAPTLTIASGVVTITNVGSIYIIDTEGAAATDNLDTINGSNDGEVIVLRNSDSARKVVLTHNIGNIYNPAGTNITLGHQTQSVVLRYDSTQAVWVIVDTSIGQATILQIKKKTTSAYVGITADIPFDDTIPQITEGAEIFTSDAITPMSASSLLRIDVVCVIGQDVNEHSTIALFRDSTADALAAVYTFPSATLGIDGVVNFTCYTTSNAIASTTFKVRAGGAVGSGGSMYLNGTSGTRKYGGVAASSITVTEFLSS